MRDTLLRIFEVQLEVVVYLVWLAMWLAGFFLVLVCAALLGVPYADEILYPIMTWLLGAK